MFSRAVRSPYPDVSPPETMLMTWRMGNGSFVTSWPATSACPDVGSSNVARILMRVVLPAPLGPSIPNSSPSSILRDTWSSAVTGPTLSSTSSAALRRRFFFPAKIRVNSRVSTAYDMGDWVHSLPDRAQASAGLDGQPLPAAGDVPANSVAHHIAPHAVQVADQLLVVHHIRR